MRLSEQEIALIKASVREIMGDKTKVWLFGSRIDNNKRGGDIDLLIEPNQQLSAVQIVNNQIALAIQLKNVLGDQRVDIVIADDSKQLIYQEARKNGIQL